ncbi:phosphotransferase enzyme family protein [Rhodobacter maris]|uniref:Ser/Thr protein kinase RdoA (MazF antagonist) n=1 Tax=Rhodobacter maris TaxID=446682 RepID=A0A285SYP0_9RHOB|nr:phosphotransferase [Rhodobacter maris]SOC13841.1 Ser/Thr protein kinase RdoA (MazF antagonist) [Rhodobacter maris]
MMDDARAYDLATAAQRAWLCQGAPLQLVWRSENIVFATLHGSGAKLALRLHRPGYQSPAAIACELAFCARLADAGVSVVEPLPAASGAWIAQVGGLTVSCLRWISGRPMGEAGAPLAGSAVLGRAEELGTLLAHLHNAADAGACPAPFARAPWDAEALLGPAPRLGPFWENPTLAPEESLLLQQAREKAALLVPQATDYGPIHADVLRSNVMVENDRLRLLDFDDCGPGFRLYELGSVLIQSWGDPDLPEQARRLVRGYRAARALPDDQLALLPLFLALRGFASAGWVVSRAPQDRTRQRGYAERAVALARMLLADAAPWEDL